MTRLLGIGDNTVDLYVDRGVQFPGGNAVNVAVLAHRLGIDTAYLGVVGEDLLGEILRDALAAEGVDATRLRTMPEPTSWSRIRHMDNDRWFDGSNVRFGGRYALDARDLAYVAMHDVVHSSIYSRLEGELPAIAEAARVLSFDFSSDFDEAYLGRVAPHVDIAFLSLASADDAACESLCRRVASLGPETVVVTRGERGALALDASGISRGVIVPAVRVVDTLGAGDGFIAAFLVARRADASLADALAAGARNAAEVCAREGAFGHGRPILDGQPGLERPPWGQAPIGENSPVEDGPHRSVPSRLESEP